MSIPLTSLLATTLFEVGKKIVEEGIVNPSLDKGLEPLKTWITSSYDSKKADMDLREAFIKSIKQIGAPVNNDDQLINWLRMMGLNRLSASKNNALRRQVVSAVLTFSDPTSLPPNNLIVALKWPRSEAKDLAKLLTCLRSNLSSSPIWKPLIDYSDSAHGLSIVKQSLEQLTILSSSIINTDEGNALRVIALERLKLSNTQLIEIENEYRTLIMDEYRMHIMQGLSHVDKPLRLPLENLYFELRLIPNDGKTKKTLTDNVDQKIDSIQNAENEKYLSELLGKKQSIMIVGMPGSGKTISLKFLALMLAMGESGLARLGIDVPYLPVYVRLVDYAQALFERSTLSLEAFLNQYLIDKYPGIPYHDKFLPTALQNGACMVLLDGLDEVGDLGDKIVEGQTLRSNVLKEVQRFADQRCSDRYGNRLIVTARTEGYASGDLAGFFEAELSPLQLPEDVQSFLYQWTVAYLSQQDPDVPLASVRNQAHDKVRQIMLSILESESVKILSINPFILSILAIISENFNTPLPTRRVELYEVITETIIKSWRRSQTGLNSRIYNSIDSTEIFYSLASLAYWLHENKPGGTMPLNDWKQEISRLFSGFGNDKEINKLMEEFIYHAFNEVGMVVERSPGQFGFFHQTLEEYLAAVEMARQDGTQRLEMLSRHWEKPYWQEVILLTAGELSQRGNRLALESFLSTLLNLESSNYTRTGYNVFLAGKALVEINPRSLGQNIQRIIKRELKVVAQNLDVDSERPSQKQEYTTRLRSSSADILDTLGFVPDDLFNFIPIPNQGIPLFWISKYPVVNMQYKRFLQEENFRNKDLWCNIPRYSPPDEKGSIKPVEDSGEKGWLWLQRRIMQTGLSIQYPTFWNHPYFGKNKNCVPVVGVTWYEANAYCKWLLQNWDILEESSANGFKMDQYQIIRLPNEIEWIKAAGGQDNSRYPWNDSEITSSMDDVVLRANISENKLGQTTPVWMYSLGSSLPYQIMDMCGNVWEWQANFVDNDLDRMALRGGSFSDGYKVSICESRHWYFPVDGFNVVGFRLVISNC